MAESVALECPNSREERSFLIVAVDQRSERVCETERARSFLANDTLGLAGTDKRATQEQLGGALWVELIFFISDFPRHPSAYP